jgi:hypothetical protein
MRRLQPVPRFAQPPAAVGAVAEPAAAGAAALSERVVADVRELRRAAANGKWLEHLTVTRFSKAHLAGCFSKLDAARFALNEMGAMSVAAYVSETKRALLRTSSAAHRATLLRKLGRDLNAAGPVLDQLIARYARCLTEPVAGARRRA